MDASLAASLLLFFFSKSALTDMRWYILLTDITRRRLVRQLTL